MPTSAPTPALSKLAVAPGPANRLTPVGRPDAVVVRKPVSVVAVVPSKTRPPSGNNNMRWVRVAPSVRTKWIE